ncbi:MAG: sterol desaturase family protein [Xanthomonadales bacterium]|nr:sterol desaturase family protein [Xanthomonadales bacterium]
MPLISHQRGNTGVAHDSWLRGLLSWLAWPVLFAVCLLLTGWGFAHPDGYWPYLGFNGAYAVLIFSLYSLERHMPHEPTWQQPDGQNLASILHTLSSKGSSQVLLLANTTIGANALIGTETGLLGLHLWPTDWPLWTQVIIALVLSELMLYWAHRLAHEWMPLWRFHAVHHSVTKLWFLNTGRFHFVDSLVSIVLGILPLVLLGASLEVLMWLGAVTAFIGMLTHCNVEMRFGPLSWIFNTPELHRWHHSKRLREGNSNYGENLMLWDQLFGSYFREDRRPPTHIGITDYMPPSFPAQILWPFLSRKRRELIAEAAGFRPRHRPPVRSQG